MTGQTQGADPFTYAFEHYIDTLYRIALHNTQNVSDAEDMVQETFEQLLKCSKPFRDPDHLKAWLIRVIINRCHDLHRSRSRQTPLTDEIAALLPAPEPGPDFRDEFSQLPEHYKNALYLHYIEGYTAAEIGRIVDHPVSTVLTWLRRGRKALANQLKGEL